MLSASLARAHARPTSKGQQAAGTDASTVNKCGTTGIGLRKGASTANKCGGTGARKQAARSGQQAKDKRGGEAYGRACLSCRVRQNLGPSRVHCAFLAEVLGCVRVAKVLSRARAHRIAPALSWAIGCCQSLKRACWRWRPSRSLETEPVSRAHLAALAKVLSRA